MLSTRRHAMNLDLDSQDFQSAAYRVRLNLAPDLFADFADRDWGSEKLQTVAAGWARRGKYPPAVDICYKEVRPSIWFWRKHIVRMLSTSGVSVSGLWEWGSAHGQFDGDREDLCAGNQ